jgi:two-component system, NarL family, invasion response regulator UvrY
MIRVLTVDDHAPFLEVARQMVLATPGFEPVGEVGSGEAGLAAVEATKPDLVFADVHMPGMGGIELARRIRGSGADPVVVLISAQDLDQLAPAVRTCGADEVVSKQDLGPATLRRLWKSHRPRSD